MRKYSIILPVHNGFPYIVDCVKSILKQSYTNFELIVLENKSTDGTAEWLNAIWDKRIKVIPSKEFLPMEKNWARILDVVTDGYVTMIGADDILLPNYLETMDALIHLHPYASVYHTHYDYIDSAGMFLWDCKPVMYKETAIDFLKALCYNKASIMGTGFMFRAEDYKKVGGIKDYPNLLFADIELLVDLTRLGYKVTDSAKTFSFRLHAKQTSASSAYSKYAEGQERFIEYLKRLTAKDYNVYRFMEENWTQLLDHYCKGSTHRLIKTPINNRAGIKVVDVLKKYRQHALEISKQNGYRPTKKFTILMAKIIDSNMLTRRLFLLFKRVYNKPIYR